MAIKFRLKGLAETFIEHISCPECSHDGGEQGNTGFFTDLTRVTFDGIIVVVRCGICGHIFVPNGQRLGIINSKRLRDAVAKDSLVTGQPIFSDAEAVRLEVERLNAERQKEVH